MKEGTFQKKGSGRVPEPGAPSVQHAQGTTGQPARQKHTGKFAVMVGRLALARQAVGAGGLGTVCVLFIPTCRAKDDMMRARPRWQRHNPICALRVESGFSAGLMKLGIASLAFLDVISQQKIFPSPLSLRISLSPLLQ